MTAFEDLERGDIVWACDPLSEKGRPMLVLRAPQFPTHGVQLITVLSSTKTYHEESITLRDDDYEADTTEPLSTEVVIDRESEQAGIDGETDVTALVETVEDTGYTAHA